MTSWEKEKVRKARRAMELAAEMDMAIGTGNEAAFREAFEKAQTCMKRRDLKRYMMRFAASVSSKVPGGCYWMPGCEENPVLPESEWIPDDVELPFM